MSSNIQSELRALVDGFVDELARLMQDAINEAAAGGAGGGRARGRGKKKGTRKKAARKKAGGKAARKGRASKKRSSKRIKRSPEELDALKSALLKEIKKKGGMRMEEFAEALSVDTKDLALPTKKLLEEKAIKTKGQTRATQYFSK